MLDDLLKLFAALLTAAAIYVLRELRRRRSRIMPSRPEITLQEAWELWQQTGVMPADIALAPAGFNFPKMTERAKLAVERQLPGLEEQRGENRQILRGAILSSAANAIHLEAILALGEAERKALLQGYTDGMDDLLRDAYDASTAEWMVLRLYAHFKFDDGMRDDWFHQFFHLARPYIREKVRLARDFVCDMDETAGRFAARYDALLEEMAADLMKVHPKRRFVPPDLPR